MEILTGFYLKGIFFIYLILIITDLEFSGEKYLVASYEYAGRLAWRMHQPTEIVRTRDWARVWYEDSLYISLVRVSPDGRWLASVRGELYGEDAAVLEIAPFEGEERDNETDDTNR